MKTPKDDERIPFSFRQEYKEKCDECGKEFVVRTQPDNEPEYYTDVWIRCCADNWVVFNLPVN